MMERSYQDINGLSFEEADGYELKWLEKKGHRRERLSIEFTAEGREGGKAGKGEKCWTGRERLGMEQRQ